MAEKRRTTSTDIPPEGKEGKKGKKDEEIEKKKGDKDKQKDEKSKDEKAKGKDDKVKVSDKAKGSKLKIKGHDETEDEELVMTPSQLMKEDGPAYRAMLRKQRFKRHWPEVTKVKITTRPWTPPPPPQRMPPITVEKPEITTRKWVPPYRRRRHKRPPLPHIPAEEMTRQLYEYAKLKKIWNNFTQVAKNKMLLQGTIGCNSKRYSASHGGAQTACIAVIMKTLLEEKPTSELTRHDVDDCIEGGDKYYRQCMLALKCYKGKPQLELKQLLVSYFFHDAKYTMKLRELEQGVLVKNPADSDKKLQDLMMLMEKRIGQEYSAILSVGDKHFLIWGAPPPAGSGSSCRTVCYIFDPHTLNELGEPHRLSHATPHDNQQICCNPKFGAGAFIRYAGVTSFVLDFLANYGNLDAASKNTSNKPITLSEIEIIGREPLEREARYEFELKALKAHCDSEWQSLYKNTLYERKNKGEFPLQCLSELSVVTSHSRNKRKGDFPLTQKEPEVKLPIAPEKGPANPGLDFLMQNKGEDFFLNCSRLDGHTFGRDDLVPLAKSDTLLHSPVDVAKMSNRSNYHTFGGKGILRGTRHMASYRYQTFKIYTAIPCCVAALAMLQRLRARAWNEDTVDETLDLGYNLYRESLMARGGPIRRLVLGEMKDTLRIRDKEYFHKDRGIAVWGRLVSRTPKVFDIKRGLDQFFKESDSGILQIPGEFETAIFNEGGRYYLYHPWPADRVGKRVDIRAGGKACILCFPDIAHLADFFLEEVGDLKKKPFSISDVYVDVRPDMPDPVNDLKPVAPNRWVVRGTFHEGDARFPEEHRYKQATPCSIAAIALSHVVKASDWTKKEVDDTLICGDALYQNTMEYLEKMGINLDNTTKAEEATPEEVDSDEVASGTLAATDVMNRFKVTEYDCIETEVLDSTYSGSLSPEMQKGVSNLKSSLNSLFKEYNHAVVTARGKSMAIWKQDQFLYFFDPHGCDENGFPSNEPRTAACLVRVAGSTDALAAVVEGNLPPGPDDSFNISPVLVTNTKLNLEIGAPETNLESKAFEWIRKGTAAIMMGPRSENTAIGKAAEKSGIGDEDKAGRFIALPAAAAFCVATESVPPPHMHQDHMFNFIDYGANYYRNFNKKTGRNEMLPEDLTEKFEMGANTFTIQLGEPKKLPLRLPDPPPAEGEGGDEEKEALGEGEQPPEAIKEMKALLFKMWYDTTKPTQVSLLVGDYHQIGIWMSAGGPVVAFDPAPTLARGVLTSHRIQKGDELRLQRIKDEMAGEGGGEDEEDEEAEGEGEEKPEPEPEPVPKDSSPVLMIFASPGELIDKLVFQGGLDKKQAIAPYKLYPVKVTNDLTTELKMKKPGVEVAEGEEPADEEEEVEALVDPLDDAALGKYMTRVGRTTASVRGRLAQHEPYFLDSARGHQDGATSVMAIVVEHIEPYLFWKPVLIDAIVKYGDRLYTMSLRSASHPPRVRPSEVQKEFHLTSFNIKLDLVQDAVRGDIKAEDKGSVLNIKRGLIEFFNENKHGVLCAKEYCVAVWRAMDDKAYVMFDPHAIGPAGRSSPGGGAGAVLYSTVEEVAEVIRSNIENLNRPGHNKFSICAVKPTWEFAKLTGDPTHGGGLPDEGYEYKVLTAYVEIARGRTILRGSRPLDSAKFARDSQLQTSCGAIVACCMSHVRQPHLWTRKTIDQIMCVGCSLFQASLGALGYEFRPGEDLLLPLQVLKRFVLGVNYVRYELVAAYSGRLETSQPKAMGVKGALDSFFEAHTHGILWCAPHAVAVWRVAGAPSYYMMEPHACSVNGLRGEPGDEGAACVMTFTSPKLLSYAWLQNYPRAERPKTFFNLYVMSVVVTPVKSMKMEPPMVMGPPSVKGQPKVRLVPATSKVGVDGAKRRAEEADRKHPPGGPTCKDAQRVADIQDKEEPQLKGQRNPAGWLVLDDGSQFLSACHSIACRKFPYASRGKQALACSVMAVAMSRVENVCRWCNSTLDQIMQSGDQLYQDSYLHYKPETPILSMEQNVCWCNSTLDRIMQSGDQLYQNSYLHFKPKTPILTMEQILRKFYTPANCVCRVVVFKPRQFGTVPNDVLEGVTQFFREEKCGVLVATPGDFAVALFKTPRGYYMFDPADRDRYGRAVPPPCIGHARACFSLYSNIEQLCLKLASNIPPVIKVQTESDNKDEKGAPAPTTSGAATPAAPGEKKVTIAPEAPKVSFEEPAKFEIYGMQVTGLRRLNKNEK